MSTFPNNDEPFVGITITEYVSEIWRSLTERIDAIEARQRAYRQHDHICEQ